MNKRHIVVIVLAGLSILALIRMNSTGEKPQTPPLSSELKPISPPQVEATDPGYYQDWFESRRNKEGIIPEGLREKWRAHDMAIASSRKTSTTPYLLPDFLGPRHVGGRTRALLMDKGDQETMFAGGVQGGFWRSSNSGASWSSTNDQAENLSITCMTQSKFNPDIIYYGTGEVRGSGNDGGGDGVFKSSDGGLTFTQLPNTTVAANSHFKTISCIEHDLKSPSTVYVGTNGGGVYRTQDHGATWAQVYTGSDVRDMVVFQDGSVLIGHEGVGIFRSPDGSAGSFAAITDPTFPSSFWRIEVENAPSDPAIVYAMFEGADHDSGAVAMFRSNDSGFTWASRTAPSIGAGQTRYNFALGVSAADPNKVVAGAQKIQISWDDAWHWHSVTNTHSDYHTFAVRNNDPDYFWIGNDGGVYKQAWNYTITDTTDLNNEYGVTQFYGGFHHPVTDATIGGTQDNGSWKVDVGSEDKVGGADGGYAYIHQQSPNIAYRSQQHDYSGDSTDGPIYMITNFNASSPSSGTLLNNNPTMDAEDYERFHFYLMNPANGYQIFSPTGQGIWRTNNTAASSPTWTKITDSISGINTLECSSEADPHLYTGGKNGEMYSIFGATYHLAGQERNLTSFVPSSVAGEHIQALKIHPNNNGTLYVGFSAYCPDPRIWKMTGGTTLAPNWTDISGDLPPSLGVNTIAVDPWHPKDVLFAGTDFGMYYTVNGGTNWDKVSEIPNTPIYQIRIRPSDRKLFIFTHGRGVWTMELESCNPITSFPYEDGFEGDVSDPWYNSTNDHINWKTGVGPTSTYLTGPPSALEGTHYMYVESSFPNYPNKTARLLSPCYDLSVMGNPYIKWNYHMRGAHIGELKLDISTDGGGTWTEIWRRSGDFGNSWQADNYSLAAYKLEHEVTFRFTATTGAGELGDIALDHIQVFHSYAKLSENVANPSEVSLEVYPNPASDIAYLSLKNGETQARWLSIYDVNGKEVHHESLGTAKDWQIDISSLPSGPLFLKVYNESELEATSKIIHLR